MGSGQMSFFFWVIGLQHGCNRIHEIYQTITGSPPGWFHMCVSRFIHYFVNYLHTGICPLFFVSKLSFSHICSVIYRTGLSPDFGPGFQVLCQSGHTTAYLTHHMKNNTFSAKVCKTWQKPCFTHQSFFIIRNDISGTLIPSQRS